MKKIDKVKTHLRENKRVYVVGGIALTAGILIGGRSAMVSNKNIQILTWKSKQTLEVYIEALGHPGYVIQDAATGNIYASQGQAAKALGVTPSIVSKHLTGQLPDAKGHVLTRLGKAIVPEV